MMRQSRYRIYEVPISYSGRGYEAGKKITWKDGLEAFWCIVKFRLSTRVVEGNDSVGETLEKMKRLRHLNEHMFLTIRPWLGPRIVEAGSGHGNITEYLLGCGDVVATDLEEPMLERLRATFGAYDNARIVVWDIREPLPAAAADVRPDAIVCLNVLEHIDAERAALDNARRLLAPSGGRLIGTNGPICAPQPFASGQPSAR